MKKVTIILLLLVSFLPVFTQQLPPSIEWQKCLGGTKDDKARSIIRTYDEGFLLAGSSRSNDGDVTDHKGSTDSTDAWLVKLTAQGTIEWQKSFGGTNDDEFVQLINTADQNYLAVGHTQSVNGDVSGNHGDIDIWVVKLNRQGNVLWQRCLGGSAAERVSSVKQTPDGGYVLVGYTLSNNGDVAGNHGFHDIWVIKLDGAGNIRWQHCFGGNSVDMGYDIFPLPGNQYLLGVGADSQDGDFAGFGGNTPIAYVLQVDSTGHVFQRNQFGQRSKVDNIKQYSDGSFVLLNNYTNCYPLTPNGGLAITRYTPDFTTNKGSVNYSSCISNSERIGFNITGPDNLIPLSDNYTILSARAYDTAGLNNHGGEDGFLSRFNFAGDIAWKKCYGGTLDDAFMSIVALDDFTYLCGGYAKSNNGDVSGNHGGFDYWVVKFSNTNSIKGKIYADYNSNNAQDAGEPLVSNMLVQSNKAGSLYGSTAADGLFSIAVDTGNYTTAIPSPVLYYTASPASRTSAFTTYNNTDSFSFALQPVPGKRDYQLQLYSLAPLRPGFETSYSINYSNVGTDTLVNKTIKFIRDSRLTFLSSLPAHTAVVADTISWNIASLPPRVSGSITLNMKAAAPPVLNIGDTVWVSAVIDTTGDLLKANNKATVRQQVSGAYDPNDKQEVHGNALFRNEYESNEWLTYTVRFQNTGTDTAFTVAIRDTLSSRLDATTLEMVSASHPCHLQINKGRYCTWTFSHILLPDSNRNEKASHGYLTYRIKPVAGLKVNDTIQNSASIYFDFNPPVNTNVEKTIVAPNPVQTPLISGIGATYCNNEGIQKGKILNLPAAADQVTVTVKLDNTVLTVGADSSFSFRIDTMIAGKHTVQGIYATAAGTKTSSQEFTITATATPAVDLSASVTTITNLTTPVVITAAGTGGGATPLYTFAKDKAFTSILQAEGINLQLTISPSTLSIGDNWIYVRLKTSASCYTVQTNIDSILLKRDATTGIIDPDNPGRAISIAPNPFQSNIRVDGFNSGKKYELILYNNRGQIVYSGQVNNKANINIPAAGIVPGVYWLSIYDAKKKLLGTEKIVKY